jgi:hypothetical protein
MDIPPVDPDILLSTSSDPQALSLIEREQPSFKSTNNNAQAQNEC